MSSLLALPAHSTNCLHDAWERATAPTDDWFHCRALGFAAVTTASPSTTWNSAPFTMAGAEFSLAVALEAPSTATHLVVKLQRLRTSGGPLPLVHHTSYHVEIACGALYSADRWLIREFDTGMSMSYKSIATVVPTLHRKQLVPLSAIPGLLVSTPCALPFRVRIVTCAPHVTVDCIREPAPSTTMAHAFYEKNKASVKAKEEEEEEQSIVFAEQRHRFVLGRTSTVVNSKLAMQRALFKPSKKQSPEFWMLPTNPCLGMALIPQNVCESRLLEYLWKDQECAMTCTPTFYLRTPSPFDYCDSIPGLLLLLKVFDPRTQTLRSAGSVIIEPAATLASIQARMTRRAASLLGLRPSSPVDMVLPAEYSRVCWYRETCCASNTLDVCSGHTFIGIYATANSPPGEQISCIVRLLKEAQSMVTLPSVTTWSLSGSHKADQLVHEEYERMSVQYGYERTLATKATSSIAVRNKHALKCNELDLQLDTLDTWCKRPFVVYAPIASFSSLHLPPHIAAAAASASAIVSPASQDNNDNKNKNNEEEEEEEEPLLTPKPDNPFVVNACTAWMDPQPQPQSQSQPKIPQSRAARRRLQRKQAEAKKNITSALAESPPAESEPTTRTPEAIISDSVSDLTTTVDTASDVGTVEPGTVMDASSSSEEAEEWQPVGPAEKQGRRRRRCRRRTQHTSASSSGKLLGLMLEKDEDTKPCIHNNIASVPFSCKRWLPSKTEPLARIVFFFHCKLRVLIGPFTTQGLAYTNPANDGLHCRIEAMTEVASSTLKEADWTHLLPTPDRHRELNRDQTEALTQILTRLGTPIKDTTTATTTTHNPHPHLSVVTQLSPSPSPITLCSDDEVTSHQSSHSTASTTTTTTTTTTSEDNESARHDDSSSNATDDTLESFATKATSFSPDPHDPFRLVWRHAPSVTHIYSLF
jgi:hypothetical protein